MGRIKVFVPFWRSLQLPRDTVGFVWALQQETARVEQTEGGAVGPMKDIFTF